MTGVRIFVVVVLVGSLPVHAQGQPAFRHALLDSLVYQHESNGTEGNLDRIDKALRIAGPNAEPRLAYFLHRYRCEELYYQGLFDESMVDAQKARRIADGLHDSLLIASSLNQVAVLLEERHDNKGAIAMLHDAVRWYPDVYSSAYPITLPHRIHGNLGRCWANLGVPDSAQVSAERSLRLAVQANSPRGTALALLELGRSQLRSGNADSALALFDQAIDTATLHNIHDVLLDGLGARTVALVRTVRNEDALRTLDRAHLLIQEYPDIAQRSVVAHYKSEVMLLAEAGLHRDALRAARVWRTLDSAVRASSARTAQRTLANLHATDAELASEGQRMELAAVALAAEHRILLTALVGCAVALILLAAFVIIYIGRGRQKEKLERLALQRLDLDRQITDLQVRQQVGEDLHDDLGAGLSALKLHCDLAEDLSTDAAARNRNRGLSRIAGDLITGMRHILWSLDHAEATLAETTTYVADRTRAFCAEQEYPVRIKVPITWPVMVPNAELRHLAWILTKEALKGMVSAEQDAPLELVLDWRDGLLLTITRNGDAIPADRTALATALSTHHLRVSRTGGSLRVLTDGPLRMEVFLPCNAAKEAITEQGSAVQSNAIGGALLLLSALFTPCIKAQSDVLFQHATLDSLFTTEAMHAPPSDRLHAINTAIRGLRANSDPRLVCHLLLSRANQMYYQGLYEVGINDVNRSLLLAQEVQDSLLIATTYNMFGLLNENLGNATVTLPWFQLAHRWLPRDTRSRYPVVKDYHIAGNIAHCLWNMARTDSATFHYRRSKTGAFTAGNLRALAIANLGLARIELLKDRPEVAQVLLDSASAQALRADSRDVYVDVLSVLAECRMRRAGPIACARTLEEAFGLLRSDSTIKPTSRRDLYKQASVLREKLGQYEEAMSAWGLWHREDSAIHARDGRSALATMNIMLDNDQRLLDERADRLRTQAQVKFDREQRRIVLSTFGVSVLLMLGVMLLYAGRKRNMRRMTALELERSLGRKELADLRSRQKLSEEMHLELGTGLEALKMRSEIFLGTELDLHHRDRLARINSLANELATSLRQTIWALDTARASLEETVHFTTAYATSYCAQQGLPISAVTNGPWPAIMLTTEQRRNIFLVVKEALHNTVKHARASEAGLTMHWRNGLSVEVTDNGRGFQPGNGDGSGNGLRNMSKRVESIGGSFNLTSDKGARLVFSVPLRVTEENKSSKSVVLA